MKRYIKSSDYMHKIFWETDDGRSGHESFNSWDECETWLRSQGLDDPDMYTDNPEINNTGVYVEHVPRFDSEEKDESWAKYLADRQKSMKLYFE